MMTHSLYLYGVIAADAVIPGIEGLPHVDAPYGIVFEGLQAVVSRIETAPFAALLQSASGDVSAIAPWLLGHSAAIQDIFTYTTILPAPFATLLVDEDGVRHLLQQKQAVWEEALSIVNQCAEMGLRVFVKHADVTPAPEPATAKTGLNYLKQRRAVLTQQQQTEQVIRQTLDEIHADFCKVAQAHVIKETAAQMTDDNATLVLRVIYLVKKADMTAFRQCAARYMTHYAWLRVTIDGPFAPYHFVEVRRDA